MLAALTFFLIFGTVLLVAPRTACQPAFTPSHHLSLLPTEGNFTCGTTREEAIAAQCVFDLMSFTWTHGAWDDAVLAEQFLDVHPWQWWHDGEGKFAANETLVRLGLFPSLHVSWGYHKLHCVYMMHKMQRAVAMGRRVDSYVADPGHTHHCLDRLDVMGVEPEKANTEIRTKFPTCLRRDEK